ncbi:substrate-binding domain-containing protein [Sunxiuqinia sp. A32]|uniref:substrate-binding domain-containing protein n=1 Tax=Sunxiuqinia sp. A32 TaxID=3461496 RepID=UPI004045E6F5
MANKKKNTVRIKDIAEKAEVSMGTVDRVLHNRGRVAEEVRKRVLRIARELEYQPNIHARALVSRKEYKIAALVPDSILDDYWLAPIEGIEKAEKELTQYGVVVTQYIFNQFDVNSFQEIANKVSEEEYDGILIAPVFYKESLPFLSKWNQDQIPFTLFNTNVNEVDPLAYIGQDSYQSGLLAGKLLHYGITDKKTFAITHIDEDVPNSSHLLRKERGFFDYFEHKTDGRSQIVRTELSNSNTESVFYTQLDELISNHPGLAGIFVTTSKSYTIAKYLKDRKNKNIRLVGYDLLKMNLDFLEEGYINFLINQNPKRQGYYGIHLLVDHLVFKKEINSVKYLPLDIITAENLHYYIEADL